MAEFFASQILYNFPMQGVTNNILPLPIFVQWLNNVDFKRCSGTTGYQWWTGTST
jgi:hypothetical protein